MDRGARTWPARRTVVPVLLVLGVALLATGPVGWVTATTWTALEEVAIAVPGSRAAPVVPAAGLIVLAAALALAMARRAAALVAAGVVVLGGVLAATGSVVVIADAAAVARAGATRAVGVGGLVEDVAVTWAPWAAVLVGVLAVGGGAASALASRRWPAGTRHEAPDTQRSAPADDWEALSRGADPSDDVPADRVAEPQGVAAPRADGDQPPSPETVR